MDETERRAGLYVITRGARLTRSVLVVSWTSLEASASVRVMLRTRVISWLRKDRLYPRLLRYDLSSLVRSVKVSLEEQMRRSLRARLNGMARLVCLG